LLAGGLMMLGCHHEGFQRDRAFRAVHIFGIGWVNDKTETNSISAFALGNLDATTYSGTLNTNAHYSFHPKTNQFEARLTNSIVVVAPKTNVIVIKLQE
jgi:hypothetical protein